jgi:hypothetical protein
MLVTKVTALQKIHTYNRHLSSHNRLNIIDLVFSSGGGIHPCFKENKMRKFVVVLVVVYSLAIGYLYNEVMNESPSFLATKEQVSGGSQIVKQGFSKSKTVVGKSIGGSGFFTDAMVAWLGNNSLNVFH